MEGPRATDGCYKRPRAYSAHHLPPRHCIFSLRLVQVSPVCSEGFTLLRCIGVHEGERSASESKPGNNESQDKGGFLLGKPKRRDFICEAVRPLPTLIFSML